jgi:hypothetical protein
VRPGAAGRRGSGVTVVGVARISGATLRVETSIARADALRARIETACGDRVREHTDPLSSRVPRQASEREREQPPAEVRQALLELKRRYYADWIDLSIPALGGRTPREVVRTASGRAAVDLLLKEFENRERRSRDGLPFDFAGMRRELHLE